MTSYQMPMSEVLAQVKALTATTRYKILTLEKRWAKNQYREAINPKNLKKVHENIQKNLTGMRNKAITKASDLNRPSPHAYLNLLEKVSRKVTRRHRSLIKMSESLMSLRSRLFKGLSSEEMDEKMQQMLRVPMIEFKGFDKLSEVEQEQRFNELLEEHGKGSGNGGFSPSLLNLPDDYHDSYMLGSAKESDGSKRRPQFIHEMMERLISAAIEPSKYKQIFFLKTEKEVKKWGHNWRQMRSEGRFAIIKVMAVLLPYLDFKRSLRMGIRHRETGEYRGISVSEIAKRSGLSEDSVDSALRNLENQGLLHPGKKQYMWYQSKSGEMAIRGLATVRCMPSNIIVRLGLGKRWLEERGATNKKEGLPEDLQTLIDDLNYANMHPEQFSKREVAFMEIAKALHSPKAA